MNDRPKPGEWLSFFDRLCRLHRALVLAPLWEERFPDHREDPWSSLALFLYGYGIGRPGSGLRRRGGAAAAALSRARPRGPYPTALAAAEATWEILVELSEDGTGDQGLHPLYPSSDPADLDVPPRPSLLEIRYVGDVAGHQASLTDFASSLIARGDASTVFDLLTEIRGVGEARASLFLRDLSVWTGHAVASDLRVLQADGELTRTAVASVAGSPTESREAHRWLLDRCEHHDLSPQRVSAGVSYFASEIAGDPFRLEECLDDLSRARRLERHHRARMARV